MNKDRSDASTVTRDVDSLAEHGRGGEGVALTHADVLSCHFTQNAHGETLDSAPLRPMPPLVPCADAPVAQLSLGQGTALIGYHHLVIAIDFPAFPQVGAPLAQGCAIGRNLYLISRLPFTIASERVFPAEVWHCRVNAQRSGHPLAFQVNQFSL